MAMNAVIDDDPEEEEEILWIKKTRGATRKL
jgi:hypothetical protein